VQHPNHSGLVMSMATMKEAVRLGALIEIVLSAEGLTGGPTGGGAKVMDHGSRGMRVLARSARESTCPESAKNGS